MLSGVHRLRMVSKKINQNVKTKHKINKFCNFSIFNKIYQKKMSEILCRSCGKSQKNTNQMKNIFTNNTILDAIFNLTMIKVKSECLKSIK